MRNYIRGMRKIRWQMPICLVWHTIRFSSPANRLITGDEFIVSMSFSLFSLPSLSASLSTPRCTARYCSASFAALCCAVLLCACSPKFDWREVRGGDAPYSVLLPAKPSTYSRAMQLEGVPLTMQMTGADADGVSFAIGSAKIDDATKIPAVLAAMKSGMLSNIHGTITSEKTSTTLQGSDIEARGNLQNGQPVILAAKFVTRGPWVYQVIVMGREKAVTRDAIDTYMTSFKIN